MTGDQPPADPWAQSVDEPLDSLADASGTGRVAPASRRLPMYDAGAIPVSFVIRDNTEVIDRDTHWETHSHPTHELLWNARGTATATIGDRTWTITPNNGLWIPAGIPHSGQTPAGTWQRAALFSIDAVPSISDHPVAVEVIALLRLLLDRLGEDGLDDASRARTEATIVDILEPAAHELLLRLPHSSLLAPIAARHRDDPADTTSLGDWAQQLGVSTRTITRAFEAETGLGFSRWTATARAQHAIGRLAAGDTIDEVAASVGYRSTTAFGTAFRRVTGMSPGRFRAL